MMVSESTHVDDVGQADRRAIAAYLHGVPCQELTALNFRLEALRRSLSPTAPMSMSDASRAVSDMITASRACTDQLRWLIEWLRYDGSGSRERFAAMIETAAGVSSSGAEPCRVDLVGASSTPPAEQRRRIVQWVGLIAMELRNEGIEIRDVTVAHDGETAGLRIGLSYEMGMVQEEQAESAGRALARFADDSSVTTSITREGIIDVQFNRDTCDD